MCLVLTLLLTFSRIWRRRSWWRLWWRLRCGFGKKKLSTITNSKMSFSCHVLKGNAFSILGGLSFLTFLGVLLYQLANQSSASGRVMDADAPLHLSDLNGSTSVGFDSNIDPLLLTKDFNTLPASMTIDEDQQHSGTLESVDQMAAIFNGIWRAHRKGSTSYRCIQRRLCETLADVDHQHFISEPVIQLAT